MHRLAPVVWTKGTFLNPQHLQSQDRFLENSLQFQLQALQYCPWGFSRLRVDREALAKGTFALSEASGVMPDGLLFDIPHSDAAPPAKPLADHFPQDVNAIDVFITIPQYRDQGFNIANSRRDDATRYRAEVELLRDENTGLAEKPVMVAHKNFRLLVDGENLEGSSALRVGRVLKSQAGVFSVEHRFVPPLLDFEASDYLFAIARRLVEILSAKSAELGGARRHKNQSLADFTTSDIARFWLLYTVNTAMPVLRHLYESRRGHPEVLFSAMSSLAGALTTFSTKIHPRDFPLYDHDNLGACFQSLDEKLRLLLETVVPSNYVSLPLKLVQPSIYATSMDDEKYFAGTRLFLAISADVGQADLISRVPSIVKICSADKIDHLVQRGLTGVPLIHAPAPPGTIPLKLNYQYFSLSQSGGPWETILRSRNLAAWVPGDIPNPQMEIVIVFPQAT